MTSDLHAAVFSSSLDRCLDNDRFLDAFYDRFLASSDEVRAKFADTSFDRQRAMLRGAFFMMRDAARDGGADDPYLRYVAERHRALDIRPDMYDLWLDCLVETVAEHDPRFSPDVEAAWRSVMEKGIAAMTRA